MKAEVFEHSDMIPVLGSIQRAYHQYFEDTGPEAIAKFQTTIRSSSAEWAPEARQLQVLDGAVFRFAWLYGYVLHLKDDKSLERWRRSSLQIPVRYELQIKDIEIRKLQLDQELKNLPKYAGLFGYKMTRAAAKIQAELKAQNLPSTYDDVFKHMCSIKFTDDDKPSKTSVSMSLKIHSRLTTHCVHVLDRMESQWGNSHPFALLAGLDAICSKTACVQNEVAAARPCHTLSKCKICLRLYI